ncbi:hypothetical protein RNZ50_15775 [Paracoccaceae bacterium Fryx2]|nr:hypothetical protein [Paracoccaceae bacterium Fryx2]
MCGADRIREALAAEVAERRRHWIGGEPEAGDRTAVIRLVAHRLKVGPDEVRAMMEGV